MERCSRSHSQSAFARRVLTKPRDVAASFVRLRLTLPRPPLAVVTIHRLVLTASPSHCHLTSTRPSVTHLVSRQSNTTPPNAPLFPLLYISASLPCHMDPALASLSFLHSQWPKHSLPFLSLPSRRTKHEHRPCLDLASSLAPSIQHSFPIQFDPQAFLSLPRRAGLSPATIFSLFFLIFYSPLSVAYLFLSLHPDV